MRKIIKAKKKKHLYLILLWLSSHKSPLIVIVYICRKTMELCVRDFCSLLNENNRFRCNVRQNFSGNGISEYLPIKPGCIEGPRS